MHRIPDPDDEPFQEDDPVPGVPSPEDEPVPDHNPS